MSRNAPLASILSLLVPGLGQIYSGKSERGAAILIAAIIAGNLYAIWLSLFAMATAGPGPKVFWAHTLPRILHDVFSAYGVIWWIWQVVDAHQQTKQRSLHVQANARGSET